MNRITHFADRLYALRCNLLPRIELPFSEAVRTHNEIDLQCLGNRWTHASIDFLNTEDLSHYVFEQLQKKGVRYGVGGYNEERIIYQRSELFDSTDGSRCIHLGVDVWAEASFGPNVYTQMNATAAVC